MGLVLEDTIANNIVLTSMQSQDKFLKPGLLKLKDEKRIINHALESIDKFDIRCTGPEADRAQAERRQPAEGLLSQGFHSGAQAALCFEPTRGIDVGAKSRVLELIVELNEMGVTVVFTSSELAELRSIADRYCHNL